MTGIVKHIAILESGGSHEEVIHPQLNFLKDIGYEVHLILRRNHFERTGPYNQDIHIFLIEKEEKLTDRIKNLRSVIRYLSSYSITEIIINTAQGAFVRDFTLLAPGKLNLVGISHNPQKLKRSVTQKLISRRITKYLVLSDYILENVRNENPDLAIGSFYPVFYPPFDAETEKETLNVCIPGAVDLLRRDYPGLLDEIKKTPPDENIRFIFLGRCKKEDAMKFRHEFESIMPSGQFIFFDEFIPAETFLRYAGNADLILPLLTPAVPLFRLYSHYKVTGAVNLAFGLKIPMLMHSALENIEDFRKTSFFWNDGQLVNVLNRMNKSRNILTEKKLDIVNNPKFSYEFQKKKYLEFLGL
jgi:hypothetical protein